MSPLVISIAAFFAVTAAVFAVIVLLSDRKSNKVEDRLSALARNRGSADPAALREEIVREGLSGLGAGVNGFLSKFTSLENLFEQAACPLTPQNFFMACGGSAVAGLVASAPLRLALVAAEVSLRQVRQTDARRTRTRRPRPALRPQSRVRPSRRRR